MGLPLRSNGRAAGAPLTMTLPGETMPGTEDGPPAASHGAVPKVGVTAGHHRPSGSGVGRLASAACGSTPGYPATQVAERAGHSVEVLLRVYAKCIPRISHGYRHLAAYGG